MFAVLLAPLLIVIVAVLMLMARQVRRRTAVANHTEEGDTLLHRLEVSQAGVETAHRDFQRELDALAQGRRVRQ